ncbi:unnamed protein product [Paramecium sonneborni]|uniref:Uncharacterized protein n=1 Tax=Paramecium sonneborni TaxID=65129 RepID=A0A8S1MLZ9_9CILI|nr:unnamed protein product [Paramecium sonneborni]
MISLSLQQSKKQKYKSVSSDERQKIIKMFLENAFSATQIAHLTGHNLSTIKAIYRIYKNEGRIKKKERRDREIQIRQNVLVFVVDEKTKKMNIIAKQQLQKDLILKNLEYPQESFQNTINETFQNSAKDVLQHLDSLQKKQCFNSIIKKAQIDGLEIKEFQEISQFSNQVNQSFKIQSQYQYFRNIFSPKEQSQKNVQLFQPQNFQQQLKSLSELKKILEFQFKDYFKKSQ